LSPVSDSRTTLPTFFVWPTFDTTKTTSKPIDATTKKPVGPSNLPTFLIEQIVKILKNHVFNFAKIVLPDVEKNAALVQKLENLVKDHAQEIVDHQQHPDAFSSRGILSLITKITKAAFILVEKVAKLVIRVVEGDTAKAVAGKAVDVVKSETAKKIAKDVVGTGLQELVKKAVDRAANETGSNA
jgi:hypothetical protein